MKRVCHKVFGEGNVVRNVDNKIWVRFEDGSEKQYKIPDSFNVGVLKIDDEWKDIIERINQGNHDQESARISDILARIDAARVAAATPRRTRTTKVVRTSVVENDYEQYLIKSGYKVESDTGNPSTVNSYLNAVRSILEEEHLTWEDLIVKIHDVLQLYDKNGAKEHLGKKSNETWINSLRRFEEFVKNS